MQGALTTASGATDALRAPRIMFKPRVLGGASDLDASFLDGFPREHEGLHRKLLDASGGQQMQIQSLGQHTGMNMIEVPQGVNVSDILRALQDHPGVITDQACTNHSRKPIRNAWPAQRCLNDACTSCAAL